MYEAVVREESGRFTPATTSMLPRVTNPASTWSQYYLAAVRTISMKRTRQPFGAGSIESSTGGGNRDEQPHNRGVHFALCKNLDIEEDLLSEIGSQGGVWTEDGRFSYG
jgi:hypothetical protein